MKLKLNNKIFIGRFNENSKLIISLEDDEDKHFFKKWQCRGGSKKDYVEDVEFEKVTERGVLKNCFPILSMNEDSVELVYDYYKMTII